MNAQELLRLADDELILGWRNSEWTGIAPFLEEDVAFSSIAQTEIGHARAWYELAAKELGHGCGLARLRPRAGRVPVRPARRDAHGGRLGADDRPPLALRDRGRDPDPGAELGRPEGRRPRGEDRPRGDLPPHARRDVGRAPARRARVPRGRRRALAVRARRPPRSNGPSLRGGRTGRGRGDRAQRTYRRAFGRSGRR